MNVVKLIGVLALVLLSAIAGPSATAQISVGTKVGEPAPSSGTYDSLGHRDPFVSLIAVRRTVSPSQPRLGSGLGSFYLADVMVKGVSRVGDNWMAILESPNQQSYVAKVRDRLADAVVKSIDANSVVFTEITEGGERPRDIRKLLRAVSEVNR
jgi:hypothetical protein